MDDRFEHINGRFDLITGYHRYFLTLYGYLPVSTDSVHSTIKKSINFNFQTISGSVY